MEQNSKYVRFNFNFILYDNTNGTVVDTSQELQQVLALIHLQCAVKTALSYHMKHKWHALLLHILKLQVIVALVKMEDLGNPYLNLQ